METTVKVNKAHLLKLRRAVALHKSTVLSAVISDDKEDWQGTEIYKVVISHDKPEQLFAIGFTTGAKVNVPVTVYTETPLEK